MTPEEIEKRQKMLFRNIHTLADYNIISLKLEAELIMKVTLI